MVLVVLLVICEVGILLIVLYIGVIVLCEFFNCLIFYVCVSYEQEIGFLLCQLQGIGCKCVVVFYQNDEFGKSLLDNLCQCVDYYGLILVGSLFIECNSDVVGLVVEQFMKLCFDVVIQVVFYQLVVVFIMCMWVVGYLGGFLYYFFVGSLLLVVWFKEIGVGIEIMQVVLFFNKVRLFIVYEYQKVMESSFGVCCNFIGLEGYIVVCVLVEGLCCVGLQLMCVGLICVLESIILVNYDGGGFSLQFGCNDYSGFDFVDFIVIGMGGCFIN